MYNNKCESQATGKHFRNQMVYVLARKYSFMFIVLFYFKKLALFIEI